MAQSTAGIVTKYAPEVSEGVRPVTGFVKIPGVLELPEVNSAPESLDTTTLDNLKYKTYIDGLMDTGGALAISALDSPEFRTAVDTLLQAQTTAQSTNKSLWLFIDIPEPIGKSMGVQVKFASLGFGGASPNDTLKTTLYATPTGEPAWGDVVTE